MMWAATWDWIPFIISAWHPRIPTASQWMQEMERTIASREQAKEEEVEKEKKKQVQ